MTLQLQPVLTFSGVLGAIGGIVVLLLLGWLIWKRALLDVQSKAMEVQREALAVYETRIAQLEEAVRDLQTENANLRGVIEGKDNAVADLVEAIASANVCLNAPTCERRLTPTI